MGADRAEPAAEVGAFFALDEFFADTGLDVNCVDVGINIVETAEALHQIERAFFTDARNAGDVVAGIPLNGFYLDELNGFDAVGFENLFLIIDHRFRLALLGGKHTHCHTVAN